jgi:hypothetical protein
MKFLKFIFGDCGQNLKMLIMMLPACLLGYWIFPTAPVSYLDFIVVVLLVSIWGDILDIKNKLNVK